MRSKATISNRQLPADTDWWRGAVIYQIYPRSFQDTNGDGIGDLKGITERLGYLAGLGVGAIRISPFFTSPMKDFGYEVSDYRDVDPMFGRLGDFDAPVARAHEPGLPEADIAYEDLQDPYGIEFWPEFKGRDGCRTPMVWQKDTAAGGFSTGKPWLPVPAGHLPRAAAEAGKDPEGLLHHYRKALAFRHANPVLSKGAQAGMVADGAILRFRRSGDEDLFVAVNLSDAEATGAAPSGTWGARSAPTSARSRQPQAASRCSPGASAY